MRAGLRTHTTTGAVHTCTCQSAVEKRFNGHQRAASVDFLHNQRREAVPPWQEAFLLLFGVSKQVLQSSTSASHLPSERLVAGGVRVRRVDAENDTEFLHQLSLLKTLFMDFLIASHFNFSNFLIGKSL